MPLDAFAVAKLLHEFGQRTALRGDNPYRARAYSRAAENLIVLRVPLEEMVAQDRLKEIPGVGDAIADIVAKLHQKGGHPALDAMRKEIPAGALEMLNVPGLRPDKLLKVYKELGISSIDELEKAAAGEGCRRGIEIRRHGEGQRHLHRAATLIESAREQLWRLKLDLKRVIPAGDFRRGCELVSDLALVTETSRLDGGPRKLVSNSQLSIFVTDRRRAGATLLFATGSKKHIDELRRLATQNGMTLDESGLQAGRALASACAGARVHNEYQSGRSFHRGDRPYPLGRRNGTKGRCTTGSRAQLSRATRLYPIPGGTTSESEKHTNGDRCLGWMTGNFVANISRRTMLLASCSLAGVPERSYAQARAMTHIILLGDSVFDNAAYVGRNPDVLRQLEQMLPQGGKATLLARDGAVISEIGNQLRGLPSDATHLVISVGGNDALQESGVLESSALSVADALTKLAEIGDGFGRAYGSMLNEVSRVGLPTAVCTIYEPRFPEASRRKLAATALTLLNDKITRQAFARGLTLIDLRLICNEDADFANPIEPSARGGAKIAQAISRFAGGATPRSSVFTDQ